MLSIDFANEDAQTQHTRLKPIFRPRQLLALTSLTSLTLSALVYIDTELLENIADNFPALQVLKVSCTERLNVYTPMDAVEISFCSPVPSMFDTVGELAVSHSHIHCI
jgi:hypothetical protein